MVALIWVFEITKAIVEMFRLEGCIEGCRQECAILCIAAKDSWWIRMRGGGWYVRLGEVVVRIVVVVEKPVHVFEVKDGQCGMQDMESGETIA